eukprot:gb/GECH01003351.1/.p1 GENE.gb/GECH01003351.1/~~gb/GECH01003351.1/.p1  ORF type:complete len:659 (+),score=156.61 gb/GECH01003351.1/:1-1977(+)
MKTSPILSFKNTNPSLDIDKKHAHYLILAEKPSAAFKISRAFNSETTKISRIGKSRFFHLQHQSIGSITIAHALGHIYQLQPTSLSSQKFPKFDLNWKPSNNGTQKSYNIQVNNIISDLQRIKPDIKEFIVATDYDIEGEVIGMNIIRNALNLNDASRMKFSTLTPQDLISAFENRTKTLNWPIGKAGEARHKIDWFYGINLSEVLNAQIRSNSSMKNNSSSSKSTSTFTSKNKSIAGNRLSVGRVQTPTLQLLVQRQQEIENFIPEPFFRLQLKIKYTPVRSDKKSGTLTMAYNPERIFSEDEAQALSHQLKTYIHEHKIKSVPITHLDISSVSNNPPVPFSLSLLQYEASKLLKMTPALTLKTAQSLYQKAYISYPRTASQKLPPSLKPWNIIQRISEQRSYASIAEHMIQEKKFQPRQGGASDPAHPAIHPTGEYPKKFASELEEKLYNLIVRRFLASCFQDPQVIQRRYFEVTMMGDKTFHAALSRVMEPGWKSVYLDGDGSTSDANDDPDDDFPDVAVGDAVKIGSVGLKKGKTSGPPFYTPASLLREMEVLGLGTKSTRSQTIELLRQRGYAYPRPFRPSPLGEGLIDLFKQTGVDEITQVDLTKKTEEQLDAIINGDHTQEEVLASAENDVNLIFKKLEAQKDAIINIINN